MIGHKLSWQHRNGSDFATVLQHCQPLKDASPELGESFSLCQTCHFATVVHSPQQTSAWPPLWSQAHLNFLASPDHRNVQWFLQRNVKLQFADSNNNKGDAFKKQKQKIKTLHSLIMTKLYTNEIICKVWLLMHHKLHASTKINCNGILRNEVWLIARWVFCGSYPFTVLHHRSNILEVLKVPCVHWTKLDQFITDSEPLLKETITKIIGETPHNVLQYKLKTAASYKSSHHSQLHRQVIPLSQHQPVQKVEAA